MTERIAYVDCFSGASGDMLLGAWLDTGLLTLDELRSDLAGLGVQGYELSCAHQVRRGIRGSKFDVTDHSQERPVRNLWAVREIIAKSSLDAAVAANSLRVFERLAEAEATVHGVSLDEVHFHEVGAIDALVDIVGFCIALRRLEIAQLYASALPLGGGSIRTEHGLLPAPAPATLALLAAVGAPTVPAPGRGELVTPTGAALLTTLARFEPHAGQPPMLVRQVGYGMGSKEFPWANVLRIWVGEPLDLAHMRSAQSHSHAQVAHTHDDGAPHHHHHEHPHDHQHDHGHDHDHEAAHADEGQASQA
jgi:uncharacterized protein (TIGR00299 family) protein